jgi:hypothetical protein
MTAMLAQSTLFSSLLLSTTRHKCYVGLFTLQSIIHAFHFAYIVHDLDKFAILEG